MNVDASGGALNSPPNASLSAGAPLPAPPAVPYPGNRNPSEKLDFTPTSSECNK